MSDIEYAFTDWRIYLECPTPPEEVARQERAERNRRPQCHCGRFVRASSVRDHGMYAIGYSWSWTCSRCGETGEGA